MVLVTDEVPRPGLAGHLAVNHAIVAHLAARGHEVLILLARPRLPWPVQRLAAAALDPARVRVEGPGLIAGRGWIAAAPRPAARILARQALALLPAGLRERLRRRARAGAYGLVDAVLGRFLDPAAAERAAARIAALAPQAVLVDTIFRAPLLRDPRLAGTQAVLIAHDVFHRRHAALSVRGLRLHPERLAAEDERDLLRLARTVVAIQPEEEALLRDLVPERRVLCAPMPALPRPRPPAIAREPGLLVFLGSDSAHNLDGMRWFLAEVWPRLRATLPGARLEICGSIGRALGAGLPEGVRARGVVRDLGPVLHRAACAVAPVLAGSGLKIKLLDYAAHGLPVVTTPAGAAGFAPAPDRPFFVTGDAEGFARAAARLAADEAGFARRERAALGYCALYAPERVFAALTAAVEAPPA
ncbi:glycosyltransferase family 4 protein [Caldovatus sp. SYSU G05006]|uniref:Glycosyltransferase family 4 protein n=1 Tax=Caldovatus aquaticus TaxID=2865671 RepID=A0ABS7F068_9PROT|nr:glycosyltransferase family 4 protein [Caldovatus aquaticus]